MNVFKTIVLLLILLLAFTSCDKSNGTHITPDNITNVQPSEPDNVDDKEITAMYLYINENKLKLTLEKNVAVEALIEILKQEDIIYTAHDYGGFEKVGGIGRSLPCDDTQMTTQSGDVVLYSGNQIVIFYGSNSWSYTKLGKVSNYTNAELQTILKAGKEDVQIRISLN